MTADWPALIAEHGPLVWRTAHRLLGQDADAADCFQQAFLSAVQLAAKEEVRHWPAVLVRLTTHRALETLRRRKRAGELTEHADAKSDDPLAVAAGGELAERLRQALADIDPVQADVFCLVCLDGHTNQDAAALLRITPGHVGVLLHRARAALRERLAAFDPRREGIT